MTYPGYNAMAGDSLAEDVNFEQLALALSSLNMSALTTGEETVNRNLVSSSAGTTASQVLKLSYFTARKSEPVGNLRMYSGGTAAGATPTLVRGGLYSIDGGGAGTLVASIASDTALFAAGNTGYTRALSAAYNKVAGQRYAFGLLVVTAAATPTFCTAGLVLSTLSGLTSPILEGQIAAQADLPATFTAASVAASATGQIYAELLP